MNYLRSLFKRLYLKYAPKGVLDPDDMNHWKEKALYTVVFISVFLIAIMAVLNFPYLITQKYWTIISVNTLSYLVILVIFFFPTINFKKRAAIISFLAYAVGISIIFTVGPFLAPREWLFFFSIIVSVLLGWPGAIASIVMNTITYAVIGVLLKIGFWKLTFSSHDPLFFWFQNATDLFLINIGTTLFVTFLFQRIEKSNQETKASSKRLLNEQASLIDAKDKLEKEFLERKHAEKERNKAQKIAGEQKKLALIGQVAGKMAHDFNNILGIIMGNTELSLMDCKDNKTKNTLKLIFEQTLRGKNLTKNLVAFAKSHDPKQEFFKINEKIDIVLSLLKKDLKNIELTIDNKPNIPYLLADPGMIEHALVNMIQNSIHATSITEHPKISIKTYCLDDHIFFEIKDTHLDHLSKPCKNIDYVKCINKLLESSIIG